MSSDRDRLDLQVAAIVAASGPDWTVEEIVAHAAKIDVGRCRVSSRPEVDYRRAQGLMALASISLMATLATPARLPMRKTASRHRMLPDAATLTACTACTAGTRRHPDGTLMGSGWQAVGKAVGMGSNSMKRGSLAADARGLPGDADDSAGSWRWSSRSVVLPWERRFLRGAFARGRQRVGGVGCEGQRQKPPVGRACACAYVDPDGPLPFAGSRTLRSGGGLIRASSRHLRRIAMAFLYRGSSGRTFSWRISGRWRVWDTAQQAQMLRHVKSGARLRCIGSDPRRAHGLTGSILRR